MSQDIKYVEIKDVVNGRIKVAFKLSMPCKIIFKYKKHNLTNIYAKTIIKTINKHFADRSTLINNTLSNSSDLKKISIMILYLNSSVEHMINKDYRAYESLDCLTLYYGQLLETYYSSEIDEYVNQN